MKRNFFQQVEQAKKELELLKTRLIAYNLIFFQSVDLVEIKIYVFFFFCVETCFHCFASVKSATHFDNLYDVRLYS